MKQKDEVAKMKEINYKSEENEFQWDLPKNILQLLQM